MNRLLKEERGAAIVIVALWLTVLVAMAGLVVDGGMQYATKSKLQNSTDAASLAGATALANGGDYDLKAKEIAQANGLDLVNDQVVVTPGGLTGGKYTTVNVSAKRNVKFGLMKVLGFSQGQIPADATAAVKVVTGMGGLIPVVVMPGEINFPSGDSAPSDTVLLKGGSQEKFVSNGPSGFRGLLSLDGKHGSSLGPIFQYGCQQVITVGTEDAFIDEETGNISSLADAVNWRIANAPLCYVPVVKTEMITDSKTGKTVESVVVTNKQVEVIGFAAFHLTGTVGTGKDMQIQGYFDHVLAPEAGGTTSATSYGLKTINLVK